MSPAEVTATHNPLRDKRDRRLPRIAGPSGLVIFGVTGDLARKKLLPAIYDLANRGLLSPGFALIGFGRRDWDDAKFAGSSKSASRSIHVPSSMRRRGNNCLGASALSVAPLTTTRLSTGCGML